MRAVVDQLYQDLSAYRSVLEIGIGTGRMATPLQERGIPLLGVDISSRMVAQGRQKGLRDVLFADVLHLPFKDKSLDATYSVHVLHLVEDWRGALREIIRVTRIAYHTVAIFQEDGPFEGPWGFILRVVKGGLRLMSDAEGFLGQVASAGRKAYSAVAGFQYDSLSPMGIYTRSLREEGHEVGALGLREKDLTDLLPATGRSHVLNFREPPRAAEQLKALKRRSFSFQWSIPEAAHQVAIARAARRSYRPSVGLRNTIELLRWDIEELTDNFEALPVSSEDPRKSEGASSQRRHKYTRG